jgi:hypothetical protein
MIENSKKVVFLTKSVYKVVIITVLVKQTDVNECTQRPSDTSKDCSVVVLLPIQCAVRVG